MNALFPFFVLLGSTYFLEVEAYQDRMPSPNSPEGRGLMVMVTLKEKDNKPIPDTFNITSIIVEHNQDSLWITEFDKPIIRLSNQWIQRTTTKGPKDWNKWVNVAIGVWDGNDFHYIGEECIEVKEVN